MIWLCYGREETGLHERAWLHLPNSRTEVEPVNPDLHAINPDLHFLWMCEVHIESSAKI